MDGLALRDREEAWDEEDQRLFAVGKAFAEYHGGVQQCDKFYADTGI